MREHLAMLVCNLVVGVVIGGATAIIPPLNGILGTSGGAKWTLGMHWKDLDGLPYFVAQGVRYNGERETLA